MKTTFELPDDLVTQLKLRAVHERRKLKDVAAEVFRRGLASAPPTPQPLARRRARLPLLSRRPDTSPIFLTPQQAHELETDAELARHEASLRQ